ncbi:cytochrome b5 domain-containing protein [Arsenicicoccus dermatophilus]|uniref:cytochrome b5 domain-containing protein n=1 Tax=Arsenicicoccus dermatophilus TaxID=1076331 RepID=UPI001F4C8266|nr:cytochrome b5-like heme/steroid binding domain-containing protein [Arsenicicoccus dermatophilus]MCH8613613.1 cytochrome b5 domain-containing protein [Arsenicicoccus dermatophilus]
MPRALRTSVAIAAGLVAVSSLSACGSDAATSAGDAASSVGAAASTAGAAAATAASTAASQAATAASKGASQAATAVDNAASATVTSTVGTPPSSAGAPAAGGKTYTIAVVNDHDNATSCWAAIDGKVYDLTTWISRHPGGPKRIEGICGQDATAQFTTQHGANAEAKARLATFQIGTLTT